MLNNSFTDQVVAQIAQDTQEPEAWTDHRRAALKRHNEFDSPILDEEAWKHDPLKGFDLGAFTPGTETIAIQGCDEASEQGARVIPLSEALQDKDLLARLLKVEWADSEDFFTSLALAFATTGSVIHVPRGVIVEKPIIVRRSIPAAGAAVFPLTVVIAEEASQVTVIEEMQGEAGGESLAVHSTYLDVGQAANVTYQSIQDYSSDVWHLAQTRASVGRDANAQVLSATIGGKHSRTVTEARLVGQGASAELLGLYFADNDQFMDHRSLQQHIGPNTTSSLFYKGALTGNSRAVYTGLVDIEHEALDSDARQSNKNLLLSSTARADASPFLEIKTSEVQRATHGVSVGRPDAETLNYIASRGLTDNEAIRLFVTGFFQELIDRVKVDSIREELEGFVKTELDQELA